MNLYDKILETLKAFLVHILDFFKALSELLYQQLLDGVDFLPVDITYTEKIRDAIEMVNYVFPIDYTLSLVALFITFLSLITAYRVVKSWIPTLAS